MSAHFKALFIAVSLLATVTAINAVFVQRTEVSIALAVIGIGLFGLAVRPGLRPRPAPVVDTDVAAGDKPHGVQLHEISTASDIENHAASNDAVIAFAQELMASTTMERFRRVISTSLPLLLGTRRVWIATRMGHGRQVIVPENPDGTPSEDLLDADGRHWTTFALRAEGENVGVLGIESSGGVQPHVRRLIQMVVPLIAQAMATAHTVDAMRETSLVDLLTGLATRREGMTRFETEIKRAQRSGATMAVLMLDLDQFKSINDRFGHATGDAMLGAVGRTIMRTLRASDIRVRWGGEEFLIVLPETDLPRAQVVAHGLLREIASAAVATPNGPTASTISIGITISRVGETDAAAMIRRADMALYHAKAAGRACVRVVLGDRAELPAAESARPVPPPGGYSFGAELTATSKSATSQVNLGC
jgi:diguanylate cyclase (GGDEF)-like protein